jgi:molybdate transport system substrate-binding protein
MPDSPRVRHLAARITLLALGLGTLAGCGGSSSGTITVLAAASLTDVSTELARTYERAHRDVKVRFQLGGSQEMAERLDDEPDPGDVLMTADEPTMDTVSSSLTGPRRIVALGSMTIAVVPGNPKRIRGLSDLTRPRLRVAVGAAANPAGRYARDIFRRAGLTVHWSSEEISVRGVLDRVRTGEADAGLVYITDLRSAPAAVGSVPIPAAQNVTAVFPAAAIKGGDEKRARSFVGWLVSPEARKLFNKYGFATPAEGQG